ncbi:MAG TPA: type II toxin-antitoxin system ParD family antitoxin [Capsulimonadaceae bacterium]|jgi:antitoxin ParD1/3/4
MNVSLTPELDAYVSQKVQTGMYHSASEVIREGLRLLREQDQVRQARMAQLRQDVELGAAQIGSGNYTEYTAETVGELAEEIKRKGRQRLGEQRGGLL